MTKPNIVSILPNPGALEEVIEERWSVQEFPTYSLGQAWKGPSGLGLLCLAFPESRCQGGQKGREFRGQGLITLLVHSAQPGAVVSGPETGPWVTACQ